MDEELMDITTEQNIEVKPVEVIENEVTVEDDEYDVPAEEDFETIEVETTEEVEIEMDEAIGWVGGDSERHYSLLGRDEPNQHPITAITGLRKELDDIEKLQTVFSDKYNHANYYKWQVVPEIPVGLFVSCPTADYIKLCDGTDDIFGVTVDSAAFVGGQDDIERGNDYGLVVCSGVVSVKCELDVVAGDSVVSNNHGYAQKAEGGYGYKVIGIQNINGVPYAVIPLGISVNQINDLMAEFDTFDKRVDKVETDIVAAINVAQQAYNKAEESYGVSQNASTKADDAVNKANGAVDKNKELENLITSTNQIAVQAQTIANNAVSEAERIRGIAEKTANDALTNVNDLIKDLEPITTWSYTDEAGEVHEGAEYFTNYVNNGVATKAEIQTVETLTEENKSSIEKNAEELKSFVSSVDKYSVGEYSQAYGLSREQAESILQVGMIYVPTKHLDTRSHSEFFVGEAEPQEFTPGSYYEWGVNDQEQYDWIEYGNSVAFFSEEPSPSRVLQYWYIDSNDAPEGYEPHALYAWKDEKWTKVNILDGNVTNRIVSGIRQTANEISIEVANARGSVASLTERIDADEATIQGLVSWSKGGTPEEGQYNLATINQKAEDAGASVALVVSSTGDNKTINSASIIAAINDDKSGVQIQADKVNIEAGNITLDGYVTFTNLKNEGETEIHGGNIKTDNLSAISANLGTVTAGVIQSPEYDPTQSDIEIWGTNQVSLTSGSMIMMTSSGGYSEGLAFTSNGDGTCYVSGKGTCKDTDIVIPKTSPNGDSVTRIGSQVFKGKYAITSVTIPDSVTSIGSYAFYDCGNLESVTIPDSVESIGNYAFYHCPNLKNLMMSNKITEIKDSTFFQCISLTSITIPDSVTSIGYGAFKSCTGLTSVTIGDSVTSIGEDAFSSCTSLTGITIPDSVISIGIYAFYGCTSLTNIKILSKNVTIDEYEDEPGTIPSTATIYGYEDSNVKTYANTYGINFVVIQTGEEGGDEEGDGEEGDPDGWNFNSTTGILTISNQNVMIDYTSTSTPWVEYQSAIKFVVVKSGITSIGAHSFSNCLALTGVTIPNSVISIGNDAFLNCSKLKSVYISDIAAWCNVSIGNAAASPLWYNGSLYVNNVLLTNLIIPNSVTDIKFRTFCKCSSLTSVTIPDSVTSIGEYAFWGCTNLTSVTIGKGVTNIENYAFANCTGLKDIKIYSSTTNIYSESTIPSTATIYGYANSTAETYATTYSRTFVELNGEEIEDNDTISYSFDSTTGTLTISGTGVMSNYASTSMPWVEYQNSIKSVIIESGITSIGDYAFYGCSNMTSIEIPDSVISIGNYIFIGCNSLINIAVDTNNTMYKSMDGNLYTKDESRLIQYAIGKTDTRFIILVGVSSINQNAFNGCTDLNNVIIDAKVTYIGDSAFANCSNLHYIYYGGTVTNWSGITKGSSAIPSTTTVCYYSETEPTDTSHVYWHYPKAGGFKISCGGNYMIDSNYFKVGHDGKIEATEANITGNIIATDGTLENMTITGNLYFGGNTDYYINANKNNKDWYIYLPGLEVDDNNAFFSGKLSAPGGDVGGWAIDTDKIYKDNAGLYAGSDYSERFYAGSSIPSDAPFRVDEDGNLYASAAEIEGNINATSGTIGNTTYNWTIGTSGSNACMYCGTSSLGPTASYGTTSNNIYIGTNGISLETGDSSNYYTTVIRSGAIVTHGSVKNDSVYLITALRSNGLRFSYSDGTRVDSSSAGTSVASIGLTGANDYLTIDGDCVFNDMVVFNGGTAEGSSSYTTSDINKKHSIFDVPDAYRTIFANLKPKIYKYNDGTSDRYHVGFIAQDVEEAILSAGLSTQDFAGFVIADMPNEETGETETVYMLRYEEFIALNTLEIQKLNERIAKLEALIEGGATV